MYAACYTTETELECGDCGVREEEGLFGGLYNNHTPSNKTQIGIQNDLDNLI